MQTHKQNLVGKTFGRYRIDGRIWQGATSVVYKATCARGKSPFGESVAIKVLHPYRNASSQRKQFVLEAKILKRLNHPNIVQVHKAGKKGVLLYIMMEFVSGKSLSLQLSEQDVSFQKRFYICGELGKAIAQCHRNGIIHNDIKPENILVSNNLQQVKLMDFGYATSKRWSVLNNNFSIGGTEMYMAPERKNGHSDERSDIYSFGIFIQQLLMGKITEDTQYFEKIVHKATLPEPNLRYPRIEDLMVDCYSRMEMYKGLSQNNVNNVGNLES